MELAVYFFTSREWVQFTYEPHYEIQTIFLNNRLHLPVLKMSYLYTDSTGLIIITRVHVFMHVSVSTMLTYVARVRDEIVKYATKF